MEKSSDFRFWEEKLPFDLHGRDTGGHEAGFDDWAGACSPAFWRRARVDVGLETSPLLPREYNYSCPSPRSRARAIADGRRELMEIIKDMPESTYELSLKDLVDDQQDVQEKEVIMVEEPKPKQKTGSRVLQKSIYPEGKQICRTKSMESDAYKLKLFLPPSLSSKKKSISRKQSKLSSRQSPTRSDTPPAKNWWKAASLAVRSTRSSADIARSASDVGSSRNSVDENTWIPFGCPCNKKPKPRRRQGCLF